MIRTGTAGEQDEMPGEGSLDFGASNASVRTNGRRRLSGTVAPETPGNREKGERKHMTAFTLGLIVGGLVGLPIALHLAGRKSGIKEDEDEREKPAV